ncbi:hypothetical protein CAOG_08380 [Capsaspora owczarzaki ATCC 30864]|uniref:Laminin G domain-containing protein n=1 Tax=Capsaspora owczarzaki (strain ATCC 30864) TaxID=595528 RepID=A0A0D2X5V1_CAPO3|nr:hypothetical protein CAOG_08380 [Capsaspora owczarzaki ATCC 30864]KJE98449.1 hypothetical protein CAOG_008380 [Capsaspora owczarzaki ATCC 30864]|eukprot:XP_004340032.1 hypothetical protein CAOG_08380 [Capsaspora owczarzaki ATCC 30864]
MKIVLVFLAGAFIFALASATPVCPPERTSPYFFGASGFIAKQGALAVEPNGDTSLRSIEFRLRLRDTPAVLSEQVLVYGHHTDYNDEFSIALTWDGSDLLIGGRFNAGYSDFAGFGTNVPVLLDNAWHTFKATFDNAGVVTFSLDEVVFISGSLMVPPSTLSTINLNGPLLIGGTATYNAFDGCISDVRVNGVDQVLNTGYITPIALEGCIFPEVRGFDGAGYVKYYPQTGAEHDAGVTDIRIEFHPNPAYADGLILYESGLQYAFALELVGGHLRLFIKGGGASNLVLVSANIFQTDRWFTVEITRDGQQVRMRISNPSLGFLEDLVGTVQTGPLTYTVDSRLYVGGHSDPLGGLVGVTAANSFRGCLRNLIANGGPLDFSESIEEVGVNTAPTCSFPI